MHRDEREGIRAFREAVAGVLRGDFSRLESLFDSEEDASQCSILRWYRQGLFDGEPEALEEVLTCACFLGKTVVAKYLLDLGISAAAGGRTGLNAFHWAANRGQLETVRLLIEHKVPLEAKSMYDGTVLGTAVWSAIHEPKPDHAAIIEALIEAGACIDNAGYPTGNDRVDELFEGRGAANPATACQEEQS